ncbi:hypothetical protein F4810DRAFT_290890 [Camillea tinctor]|nr:hypothetical protein F4810DRAFT_290890 [Camillea tinctor]
MKYIFFLLLHASFANMLQLDVGTDPTLPSCASRCMVDSMFITPCLDMSCLCHTKEYQRSLFQCLFSQCDPTDYGPALSRTIASCLGTGAEIYMVAPAGADPELLRLREADYLAGKDTLADVPGLELRQESIGGGYTVTTTVTQLVPVPPPAPTPTPEPDQGGGAGGQGVGPVVTPFAPTTQAPEMPPPAESTTADRPWMITRSVGAPARRQPRAVSFSGLVLWLAVLLVQDYWINGY